MFTTHKNDRRRNLVSFPFPARNTRYISENFDVMLKELENESKLLQYVLSLRPISSAFVYSPGYPVTINAMEFFREIAHDNIYLERNENPTEWLRSQRLVVQLVDFLLECFNRINQQLLMETNDSIEISLNSAAQAAGYAMANTLIQTHVNALMQESNFDASSILITLVLSSMEYGHMHPLHKHPLIPSNGNIVFTASRHGNASTITWQCSICHRNAMAKTDVVYRCGGCDVNLCKECFTRIPAGSAAPSPPPRASRLLDGLWSHSLHVLCSANMHVVALETAQVLRIRATELPLTAGTNFLAILQVLEDMVSSRLFCASLVNSTSWLPAIISGKSMEISSFLGPFFRHCSLPDDIVPGDVMCGPSADASRQKARDLLDGIQSSLTTIVRVFLRHGGAIKEAMLCWIACSIEANGVRRRLGHSPVECASDGFLINLSAVTLSFVESIDVTALDPSYHMNLPGRVSFSESARILPKVAMAAIPPAVSSRPVHEYYPHYDAHLGVVCDHCQDKDFVCIRYKCANCDDYDLCAKCYDLGHAALHHSEHVFIRVSIPLPQVTTWPFRKLVNESPEDANEIEIGENNCDSCHCVLHGRIFQCGQCDRSVCAACVEEEEHVANRNPHRLHGPGHHYLAVSSRKRTFRLMQSLYPPQFLPQRQDHDDIWWYFSLKCLHVGPVLTLMRYVSVHREYQQLKALCNMENRTRQQSQVSGARRSTRATHNMNLNANHVRVDELLKTKSSMEVQLFAPTLIRSMFRYYMRVAKWLTTLLEDGNEWSIAHERDIPAAYAQAPESVLCNLADMLYLVGVHPCDGIDWSPIDLKPMVSFLFYLIAARQLTNSPHVRVQLIRALLSLAPITKDSKTPLLYEILVDSPFLRAHAMECLLAFHNDLDQYSNNTGGDTTWGLLPARLSTLLLLRWLWNAPLTSIQSAEWADHHGVVLLFSGVLHDITRLVDEANVKVQAMRRLQELQESPSSATGAYFQPAMMQSYMALHFNKARTNFRVLIECLELLAWIVSVPSLRAVLCRRSLVDQTASSMSFIVATLETQLHPTRWGFSGEIYQDGLLALAEALIIVVRCAGLHESCPESSSWKLSNYAGILMEEKIGDLDVHQRWKLSSCLFRLEKEARKITPPPPPADVEEEPMDGEDDDDVALAFLEQKAQQQRVHEDASRVQRQLATRFIAALAADGRFESVRFRRAAVLLRSDPSLTTIWREKFLQVIEQTEQLMVVHEQMETRLGAVPEEYLDPILHTLMLHPVQLPSGHIVDRTMIERHLLSASVNPFSREPLTIDMLLPCTELQQTIERFVRSKLVSSQDTNEEREAWGLGWDCLFDNGDMCN